MFDLPGHHIPPDHENFLRETVASMCGLDRNLRCARYVDNGLTCSLPPFAAQLPRLPARKLQDQRYRTAAKRGVRLIF